MARQQLQNFAGSDDPARTAGRARRQRGRSLRLACWAVLFFLVAAALWETSSDVFKPDGKAYASGGDNDGPLVGHHGAGADRASHEILKARSPAHSPSRSDAARGTLAAPRPVVPPTPPGWHVTATDLTYGGKPRYYLVARPDLVTATRLPLLMVLPGRDMTPARIEELSKFLSLVGQAVVVYPAGYDKSWNAGFCCGGAHRARIDDVGFLKAVIRSVLRSQSGTAAGDVYLAGFSNGGRMALLMACDDPWAFAGIAAVEAVPVSTCNPRAPVPVMVVAQSHDPLLTIRTNGVPKHIAGRAEITVGALVTKLRDADQCSRHRSQTSYGSKLTVESWDKCGAAGRLSYALYHGGAHRWPQGGAGVPSAAQLIWSFFQTSGSRQPSQ